MTDIQIDALSPAGTLTGNENVPVSQAGVTVRTTLSGVTSFAVAQATAGAAASATLAGHFANDNTDVAVPGQSDPTARGAKFWAGVAQTAAGVVSHFTTRNGYLFVVISPLKKLLLGIKNDGTLIAKLPFVNGKGSTVTRNPDHTYQIDTVADTSRKHNGILAALISPSGRNIAWWRWDGTLITKLFFSPGQGTTVSRNADGSYSVNTPADTSKIANGLLFTLKSPAGRLLAAYDRRGVPVLTKVQQHEVASFDTDGTISAWVAVDAMGNPVLKTMDASKVVRTLTGISNVSGLKIVNGKVVFFGTVQGEANYYWCYPNGTALYHAVPVRAIMCDGDSLTASSGITAPNYAWPYLLGIRNNVPVWNGGVPGTKSQQIAFRAGGYTATATVAGGAIPASGAVTLSSWTLNGDTSAFAQPFYPQTDGYSIRAFITGSDGNQYEGTLSVSGGVYSFTRTTAGASVPVPSPATITANLQGRDEWIHIIRLGQNDGYDQTQVMPALAAIVNNLKSLNIRYLIISETGKSTEILGSAAHTTMLNCNAAMQSAYPNEYVELRNYLVSQYNPTIPQDVTDHSNDVIPSSLRVDDTHNNNAGYDLTEQYIATISPNSLAAKGWLQ
jgi:lysophospholipase L1-like esterase